LYQSQQRSTDHLYYLYKHPTQVSLSGCGELLSFALEPLITLSVFRTVPRSVMRTPRSSIYSLIDCSVIVYNDVVSLTHYYDHYLLVYVAIQDRFYIV
jgi:hypothetical protein